MTRWFHAYCNDCKDASPPLFVDFNGEVSLYPIDEKMRKFASEWLDEHSAPLHDVRLVDENDGNRIAKAKFPPPKRLSERKVLEEV